MNILIVDDEDLIRREVREFLEQSDCRVFDASSAGPAMAILRRHPVDVVLLDIKMPETDGFQALEMIRANYPKTEVIMITGHGDMQSVIEAMRRGAFDFFNKPLNHLHLLAAIERSRKYIHLQRECARLKDSFEHLSEEVHSETGTVVGQSEAIRGVLALAQKAALADNTTVLIYGPSGSGKEAIAQTIHHASARKNACFYPVNCSAIPEALIESELFGAKKGAFTGAVVDRKGYFELAQGGTLFLDEVGDMPLSAQAKVLRALESRKIKPVGGAYEVAVDVRVVCATHHNLKEMIAQKEFREDLYYRLSVFEIFIPGLAERREDIPLLTAYFVSHFSAKMGRHIQKIDTRAMHALSFYAFPGNIRELKNMIERAVILCETTILTLAHFPALTPADTGPRPIAIPEDTLDLALLEKNAIVKALSLSKGNVVKAASFLNISRHALDRRLQKYGLKNFPEH